MGKLDSRERFNRWSRGYDSRRGRMFFGHLHRLLLPWLDIRPGMEVLDIGCGTGSLLVTLAGCYPQTRLTGVDFSEGMIEAARAKAGTRANLSFQKAAAEALPFAGGTFDLAVSTFSLHHWADLRAGLIECYRVLKPSGRLALVDITDETAFARVYRILGPLGNLISPHAGYVRPAVLAGLMAQAGFEGLHQQSLWPAIVLTLAGKSMPAERMR